MRDATTARDATAQLLTKVDAAVERRDTVELDALHMQAFGAFEQFSAMGEPNNLDDVMEYLDLVGEAIRMCPGRPLSSLLIEYRHHLNHGGEHE